MLEHVAEDDAVIRSASSNRLQVGACVEPLGDEVADDGL